VRFDPEFVGMVRIILFTGALAVILWLIDILR
jgi:hypothetical protein